MTSSYASGLIWLRYIYSYIYKDIGPRLYRYIVSDLFIHWYGGSAVYTYVYTGCIYGR